MSAWPVAVLRSPWLRGIGDDERAQLEAGGEVTTLEAGARVFGPDEAADALFIVARGQVDVRAVRRGDAGASPLRRAGTGDAIGQEALVRPGMVRLAEAVCAAPATVVRIPIAAYRRAIERSGAEDARRLAARLREDAARDALRASSLARELSAADVEALCEGVDSRELGRGDVVFAQGDPATHAYVVADGMVRVTTEDDGRVHVRAYLSRGDLIVDGALAPGGAPGAHEVGVEACGPAWIVAIPSSVFLAVARRAPSAVERARRVLRSAASPPASVAATRHVNGDLWRFAVAGSMLVIDDEVCVRCGHCAWSCAQAHDDGVSRLVRRGEKVLVHDAVDASTRALIVPASCQHCKHPACMIDCPTGAIGRDPRGQVFVREDLCVGCGRCEKACPWGSVQMAPRSEGARAPSLSREAPREVAVKCDACRDVADGPACVSACPVDAIARIEPVAAIADVRAAVGPSAPPRALPRPRSAWPWVVGAVPVAVAVARAPLSRAMGAWGTGLLAGLLMVGLAGYVLVKRTALGRRVGGRVGTSRRSRVRPHAIAHLVLGVVAVGAVLAHAGMRVAAGVAGALLVAFAVAAATGILAAIVQRALPPALARIESQARLPEDLAPRARELDERTFGALTGRSASTKAAYAVVLAPYARAALGPLSLVLRGLAGRTIRDERDRLTAQVTRTIGHATTTLEGADDLVRLVVQRRAIGAERWLQGALRAVVPVHVVAMAVLLVLLVAHVVAVVRPW